MSFVKLVKISAWKVVSSFFNKNFRTLGDIHIRIIITSYLTIIFSFFNLRKINFIFDLNTSFSNFKTSMHFLINIRHFIGLNRSSFSFKLFFVFRILINKTKETLMIIRITVFINNTQTIANSSWNLSFCHSILNISFLKFFSATVVKLFCFRN